MNTAGLHGPTHKVGEATARRTGATAYALTCLVSMDLLAKSGKLHTTMCSEGRQPEPRCRKQVLWLPDMCLVSMDVRRKSTSMDVRRKAAKT